MINMPQFQRNRISTLQFMILLLLNDKSRYGYEILRDLREHFRDVWEPKTGTIYPTLKSLKRRGFIETESRDGKTYYRLSEKGDEFLIRSDGHLNYDFRLVELYFKFIISHMPSEMKQRILRLIQILADREQWQPIFIKTLLEEATDRKMKRRILVNLRTILCNRLEYVNREIQNYQ